MSFISVGYEPNTGTILAVGGVRVFGLRAPVTIDVGAPKNPKPSPKNPTGGPKNPPHHGPPSQIAPTNPSQVMPHSYAKLAPLGAPQNPPPIEIEHAEPPILISAPQNKPEPFYLLWRGW